MNTARQNRKQGIRHRGTKSQRHRGTEKIEADFTDPTGENLVKKRFFVQRKDLSEGSVERGRSESVQNGLDDRADPGDAP
jgi:hypothetical protein